MRWGIPFVLVGLHSTIGRFLVDAAQHKRSEHPPAGAHTGSSMPTANAASAAAASMRRPISSVIPSFSPVAAAAEQDQQHAGEQAGSRARQFE